MAAYGVLKSGITSNGACLCHTKDGYMLVTKSAQYLDKGMPHFLCPGRVVFDLKRSMHRGVDPVLKVGGGTEDQFIYTYICMHNIYISYNIYYNMSYIYIYIYIYILYIYISYDIYYNMSYIIYIIYIYIYI